MFNKLKGKEIGTPNSEGIAPLQIKDPKLQASVQRICNDLKEVLEENQYAIILNKIATRLEKKIAEENLELKDIPEVWTQFGQMVAKQKQANITTLETQYFNPIWELFSSRHTERLHKTKYGDLIGVNKDV